MQSLEVTEEPIFSPLLRRYSLEEFWALPEPKDRFHYDLIGGYLFMVPPPEPLHDRIDSRLNKLLVQFLIASNSSGEVHHPRAAIYKEAIGGTYLEPDMMYVSEELRQLMGQKRSSADIVFEYASKSTAVYDRTTKSHTYLALGVRELWLIDSDTRTIEVRYVTMNEGRLSWETWIFSRGDFAESRVLEGWRVSVDELFEGLV
jgi:Uma2 family endonuclease